MAVATEAARAAAAGASPLEVSALVARIRVHGGPHVWPRVWTLESSSPLGADVAANFDAWLSALPAEAPRRCGVAQARTADGGLIVVALVVDVLADLEPLPQRARLGQWLRLRARALVLARAARVVLLGPRGVPRTLPSELDTGDIRAVFSLDQPGLWRVQVLLDTDSGPRPSLEAWVFVDVTPSLAAGSAPAPGERLGTTEPQSARAAPVQLLAMLNQARSSEGRAALGPDARLDRLAQAHAEAMQQRELTAHDVGRGLPDARLHEAGLAAARIGENVAHARTLALAHRALWDSPAHRGNLLDPGFVLVGLGVAETPANDPAAGVWVCELFADQLTPLATSIRVVPTDLTDEIPRAPVVAPPNEQSF